MDNHILDRPIWSALTTTHAHLSTGSKHARRFESDISPFGAACDESVQSLSDLATIIPDGGQIMIAQVDPIICPPRIQASFTGTAHQMVYEGDKSSLDYQHKIERLSEVDSPAMIELACLTKPGPFLERTHILGEFWGVKHQGQLIAMAGERLRQPGFSEISGVCTHPDHQGKSLGRELCVTVLRQIIDRGETPYLHVFSDNKIAIKLYEKLGFKTRKIMNVAALEKV